MRGLVIAGTKSGSGKTTITLGLLAALVKRGCKVASFKVGPDFIDPGHHSVVTGRASYNLDGWMLPKNYNLGLFRRNTRDAELAVVEGVMGLFDGYDGRSEAGSTAQMAKWLGLPVLLVVDARSMARSAAALVLGFASFDSDLRLAGVLFNNIGSQRHLTYLTEAMEERLSVPCLGGLPHQAGIAIPERHLGLVTREDHALSPAAVSRLAAFIEGHVDLDRLLAQCTPAGPESAAASTPLRSPQAHRVRIGVARDRAFCFYYPDNFDLLRQAGAQLVFFSPLHDAQLPPDIDGLYLGGGYPELCARELSANTSVRAQIRRQSQAGMPIYAECGGFMYLCRTIHDTAGQAHPMSGCFPMASSMHTRMSALGYREIALTRDTMLGPRGLTLRGHEFHYSALVADGSAEAITTVYRMTNRAGLHTAAEGYQIQRTLGSYVHVHWGSCPEAALHMVQTCGTYRQERTRHET